MGDVRIRPMTVDDLATAERISDEAFYELDLGTTPPAGRPPERRTPERSALWIDRTGLLLGTDPGGAWVAEDDTGVVGFANGFRRGDVWALATFAVQPGRQGAGIGAPLLRAATEYGAGCPRWMLSTSDDPRALRRYHRAGLALHPQMQLAGAVDPSTLPAVRGLREGTPEDREWMDELDLALRGAPHGPDHEALSRSGTLLVSSDRRGYAYAGGDWLHLLAARDVSTARTLLWEVLARSGARITIPHVTAANRWAVGIGLDARLELTTSGYLALRGMEPPAPYVHNGALL
ncbi:GNAT family N-acetyltransferase [Nocardioides sp. SYSU DS0651]|uniref:GNAT family N-acetyltransferase n=1 Tax=Nocardioides sp. SYSU DS0651 TaxID=3415955 RepID=UPI003F4CAB1F